MWKVSDDVAIATLLAIADIVGDAIKDDKFKGNKKDVEKFVEVQARNATLLALGMRMCSDIVDSSSTEEEFQEKCAEALFLTSAELAKDMSVLENMSGMASAKKVAEELGIDEDDLMDIVNDEAIDGTKLSDETIEFLSKESGVPKEVLKNAKFSAYDRKNKRVVGEEDIERIAGKREPKSKGVPFDLDSLFEKADESHGKIE